MHELSIAMSLVERASEEAERRGGCRVEAVYLRLGPLSGVVEDALRFSWDLATADTPVAGARLEIERVPLVVRCPGCHEERELPSVQLFRCPACGGPVDEVVSGRELELRALEITDREEAAVAGEDRRSP